MMRVVVMRITQMKVKTKTKVTRSRTLLAATRMSMMEVAIAKRIGKARRVIAV